MSLRARGHKVIWTSSHWLDTQRIEASDEFYKLDRDPNELENLRSEGRLPAAPYDDMSRQLEKWCEATRDAGGDEELPPDVIEQLKKLGYL